MARMTDPLNVRLSRHPRLVVTGLVAIVVLAGAAVGLSLGVLGSRPTADSTASPSASADPSALPNSASPAASSPMADPSVSPPPDGVLLQVSVDGLRMRAAAGTGADIVRTLDRSEVVRATSGPLDVEGFAWYEVVDLGSQSGWVAMGREAGQWLEVVPAEAATSDLVLRFERNCDVNLRSMSGIPIWPADLTLTADGRVFFWRGGGSLGSNDGAMAVRQLNPRGVAQFRRDVLAVPALRESASYGLEHRQGAPEAPGHGLCGNSFIVGEGPDAVVVHATNWQGDEEEAAYWVPSPERKALDELALHLEQAEAWLGEAAWSDAVARPRVSGSYMLWLEPPLDIPPEGVDVPTVSGVQWPFDGPIEEFGDPVEQARCGYLEVGQAFETLRLMRERGVFVRPLGADPVRHVGLDGVGNGAFATDAGWFSFWITPRSPDGYPRCPA